MGSAAYLVTFAHNTYSSAQAENSWDKNINFFSRNHPVFDVPRTTSAKRKHAKVSSLEECAHGVQGIRQFHRRDEEKILPHKRACVDLWLIYVLQLYEEPKRM